MASVRIVAGAGMAASESSGEPRTAADIYKAWAVRQPWCRRTLQERVEAGDVPRWLTEPTLFYAYGLRGEHARQRSADRLPLVGPQAEGAAASGL